ncbi:hypothetical protein Bca52824_072325 [Brassica carinata]|uniref:Uncharacterized protein n=1 Tax=Brassica carinata TaxID=52824 RepID=A0A8X7U5N2_BRACI|nr:hypothetical protein Bca52824_072325 [Brassica carinata]
MTTKALAKAICSLTWREKEVGLNISSVMFMPSTSFSSSLCTEKDHNFLPPIVNLIISRRLDHQRLKLLDAFRAPVAGGSSPDEHDDAADDNSYGGGYNHGGLTILDEHGAQSGGDGLVSGGVRHVGDDD